MAPPFKGAPIEQADLKAAEEVLTFWFEETKPYQWYRRDDAFDASIRNRFEKLHQQAATGELDSWAGNARSAFALILILDQFSRNLFRDTPQAFSCDDLALAAARDAIARGFDKQFGDRERAFFYMPFMHAEDLAAQEECVALCRDHMEGSDNEPHAIEHRDIIERFGRFPHRNKILGRTSTEEEIAFLEGGGFNP